jgi:hypothetical protein
MAVLIVLVLFIALDIAGVSIVVIRSDTLRLVRIFPDPRSG